jgi:hypothetical protein
MNGLTKLLTVEKSKNMKLKLLRISKQKDSINGLLFINDKFVCYTLEDEERAQKIYAETAIPKGTYEIKFRNVGGFHSRYAKKFSDIHKGMLELQDVPGFEYILIHVGNTDENTAGCILVGDSQENNYIKKDGFIGSSTQAYRRIYPVIAKALENNEKVFIEIADIEKYITKPDPSNKSTDEYISSKMVYDKLSSISGKLEVVSGMLMGRRIE